MSAVVARRLAPVGNALVSESRPRWCGSLERPLTFWNWKRSDRQSLLASAPSFKLSVGPQGRTTVSAVAFGGGAFRRTKRAASSPFSTKAAKTQEIDPIMGSLYDRPDLYDAAFSFRELEAEADFLQRLYKAKTGGQDLSSVLDLGCGTGRHIRELAKAGVACRGVDANKNMLKFASQQATVEGVSLELSQEDLRSFRLKEGESVDMALILMGTLQHMLSNEDAIAAVQAASEAVRPGGLVVLELAHPYDLWDGTLAGDEEYPEVWDADLKDGSKLYIEWGREGDPFDGLSQVLERTVCATVTKNNEHVMTLMDICDMRQFSMQELNLIAVMLGLEVAGVYGEMNLDVPLDDDEAYRLVMCLRKEQ